MVVSHIYLGQLRELLLSEDEVVDEGDLVVGHVQLCEFLELNCIQFALDFVPRDQKS